MKEKIEIEDKVKGSKSRKKKVNLPLIEVPYVVEPHLLRCKLFLEKLCKEKNETALIFFDSSLPYDDEVVIKLNSHKFCNSRAGCVSLRFEKGILKAYDSHFDGGTSTIWSKFPLDEESKIKEIMQKVFERKCEDDDFTCKEKEDVVDFEIGEDFWKLDEYTIHNRLKNENYPITDRKKIFELQEIVKKLLDKEEKERAEEKRLRDLTITDDFIFREDLNDWLFKEDDFGRYRERIIDRVEKFGVMNWFKKIGYPVSPESIYKNKYVGEESTLKEQVYHMCMQSQLTQSFEIIFEDRGFYIWESWLPLEKWNDKELHEEYRVGSPAYLKKKAEQEKDRKKQEKKIDKDLKKINEKKNEMLGVNLTPKEKYLEVVKEVLTKEEYAEEKEKLISPIINIERRSDKSHLVYLEGHLGLYSRNEENKEADEIAQCKKLLIENGVNEKDIVIKEHFYEYYDDNPKHIEEQIKKLSEDLKKVLQKKYGYPVKLQVMKETSVMLGDEAK